MERSGAIIGPSHLSLETIHITRIYFVIKIVDRQNSLVIKYIIISVINFVFSYFCTWIIGSRSVEINLTANLVCCKAFVTTHTLRLQTTELLVRNYLPSL